jgi:hypothetical protein
MITREFLDQIKVRDVMEDWGLAGKSRMIAKVVGELRQSGHAGETKMLVEALSLLSPECFFIYECDHLLVRANNVNVPVSAYFAASYVEEEKDGCLKIVKNRFPDYEKTFRRWMREAISSRTFREDGCDSKFSAT